MVDAAAYMGVQIFGGICAGFMYAALMHGETFFLKPNEAAGFHWGHAAAAEIIFTFVLCYVVLCVATTTDVCVGSKEMFGLAIGSCVTVGGFAVGAISGGSLNPAVSFGIDTAHFIRITGHIWGNCLAYTAFEFVGALLAA